MQAFALAVFEFMREKHGGHLLDGFVSSARQSMTKSQAAMLVADVLEWNQDLDGEDLTALDEHLANRGLPTFTLVRRRQDREFANVLARGTIASDDEWRLLNARLSDLDGPLSENDQALANRMLQEYENEKTV